MGPMTGRAAGYCAGYGRGGGRGHRHWFCATGTPGWMRFGGYAPPYRTPDPETEKQALRGQADAMQAELEAIKKRLAELEGEAA